MPIADFRYDDYDVPDTMNVHGIYDTKASMVTFESRSEFQSFLQAEAGISGSYFGFHAGVKSAWGESKSGSSQTYMALLTLTGKIINSRTPERILTPPQIYLSKAEFIRRAPAVT